MKKQSKDPYPDGVSITPSELNVRHATLLTNLSYSNIFLYNSQSPWHTKLKRYQIDVAIDYYNLDPSNPSQIKKFILKYFLIDLPDKSNKEAMSDLDEVRNILKGDQPKYENVLTKVVYRDKLSEDESDHVDLRLNDGILKPRVVWYEHSNENGISFFDLDTLIPRTFTPKVVHLGIVLKEDLTLPGKWML